MEEVSSAVMSDASPTTYLAVAAAFVLLSLWALWQAVRKRWHGVAVAGLWLVSVAVFCGAAALLIDLTGWTPYTPAPPRAGTVDPQMGTSLESLLYNAILIVIAAVALSTLVLAAAKRRRHPGGSPRSPDQR